MVVISSSTDEKRTLTAIWKEKHMMINFEVYDGRITIQYDLVDEANWPEWIS